MVVFYLSFKELYRNYVAQNFCRENLCSGADFQGHFPPQKQNKKAKFLPFLRFVKFHLIYASTPIGISEYESKFRKKRNFKSIFFQTKPKECQLTTQRTFHRTYLLHISCKTIKFLSCW